MPIESWPHRQLDVLDAIAPFVEDLMWRLYELDGVAGIADSPLIQRATIALEDFYGENLPQAFAFSELKSLIGEFTHINEIEVVGCLTVDDLPLPSEEEKYKAAQCVIHDYGLCLVDTRRPEVADALTAQLPFCVISEESG